MLIDKFDPKGNGIKYKIGITLIVRYSKFYP